ncbi:MAG TPA: helix-turn-helix transcriptional regulator [Casimicrobiaceae bacterium]|nr:helix-turn-helix transcriptional regulator [Casimicrobiaceae bacterium]
MPNVAGVFKEEMSRVARKEIRSITASLKKSSAQYRRVIAALRRDVAKLQQSVRSLERKQGKAHSNGEAEQATHVRFVAKGLRSQRERLGLSADAYAKLLGVSAQSIYNWERGVARPRASQIASIAALRALGKREAKARLDTLKSNGSGRSKRKAK